MTLLQLLKTQTTTEHIALEDQLDIVACFRSRETYTELLKRFFTFYEPLEQALISAADWEKLGWDFDSRRKTPWLQADLAVLGVPTQELSTLPFCADLPPMSETAQVIGCLYVIEGSTLGGQVITKLLQQSLNIQPEDGGCFFAGYRDLTGPKWKQFGAWAESWASEHPGQQVEAVEAARKTFVSFSKWFN